MTGNNEAEALNITHTRDRVQCAHCACCVFNAASLRFY